MKPVDAHCHLHSNRLKDFNIQKIPQHLEFAVTAGTDPETSKKALQHAENDFVEACVGVYPREDGSREDIEDLADRAAAIGEVGLDYHHGEKTPEMVERFRSMLELAESHGKPAVIHSRDAEGDVVEILESYEVTPYVHCFNGSLEQANRILDMDGYVGVTRQVESSKNVRKLAEGLDLEGLLIETDSPWLGMGDDVNTPLKVGKVADEVAELKGVAREEVVEASTGNAVQVFRDS